VVILLAGTPTALARRITTFVPVLRRYSDDQQLHDAEGH